jgi:hypothetical protein
MGGSKTPPKPPNPATVASQQTQSNKKTGIATQHLNEFNQTTPTGSSQYTQVGTNPDGTPIMQLTTALSAPQQALLSGQEDIGKSANTAGLTQLGATALAGPIDLSNNSVMDAITATYQPAFQRNQDISWEKMNSDLANRGLFPGSEAYDRAVHDFQTASADSWNNIMQNARAQSVSEMEKGVFDPIQAANALRGMGAPAGVGLVNTPTTNIQPTNTAQIQQDYYQNQLARTAQMNANNNAFMGGLAGLGGAAIGGIAGGPMGASLGASMGNALANNQTLGTGMYNPNSWNTTVNYGY